MLSTFGSASEVQIKALSSDADPLAPATIESRHAANIKFFHEQLTCHWKASPTYESAQMHKTLQIYVSVNQLEIITQTNGFWEVPAGFPSCPLVGATLMYMG